MATLTISSPAPLVVSRIASQFLLRCLQRIGACVDGNMKLGVAFLAIAQATCYSSPEHDVAHTAGIRAMSAAMGIPYETMRRHFGALVRAGLCERCDKGGVAVATTPLARETVTRMRKIVLGQYLRIHSELASIGFDFSRIRTGTDGFASDSERMAYLAYAASNFYLRLLEVNIPVFEGDVTLVAVWTALMCEARSHIMYDSVLAWKYGTTEMPIPDQLLRPVSVLAVSQSLSMPFETTRRHVAQLQHDGLCVRVKRAGVLVPEDVVQKDPVERIASLTALRLFQSFSELGAAGFGLPVALAPGASQAEGHTQLPAEHPSI